MARLFIPGPTDVAEQVLQEQTRPIIGHRSDPFKRLFSSLQGRLRTVFQTENQVVVATTSGTGLFEGLLRNLVSTRLLVCVAGAFGHRWAQVAESNGLPFRITSVQWGQPNTPEQVAEALSKNEFDTLVVVHSETSTGVQNPIAEIASSVRRINPEVLLVIDAVSSLGGIPIETDAWRLDVVVTSSQKCLALPPGLAFASVNDRALERARGVKHRGWYFDLVRMEASLQENATHTTPAISLFYALDKQLDRIMEEGLSARYARHAQMAEIAQSWAAEHFAPFAAEGYRSKTVTTVRNTRGMDLVALNASLAESEQTIANGYAHLKDKTFRIGHMGETTPTDLEELLAKISAFIH